jgi:hypothetical protein
LADILADSQMRQNKVRPEQKPLNCATAQQGGYGVLGVVRMRFEPTPFGAHEFFGRQALANCWSILNRFATILL